MNTNQKQHVDIVKLWTDLTGKQYVPSWSTNVRHTFFRTNGWLGPEHRRRLDAKLGNRNDADDIEKLLAALRESTRSLDWAAMVINDIPANSHFMQTIAEAKALVAEYDKEGSAK